MKDLIFIHGGQSFSRYEDFLTYLSTTPIGDPCAEKPKRWKHTLRADLSDHYRVLLPSMPNSENAHYQEWKLWFERFLAFVSGEVVLVGHSQGGYFLAKYLSENTVSVPIRALYLIAAPSGPDDFGGEDGGDFRFDPARAAQGLRQAEHMYLFHSTDDPVVPFSHAERYSELLPQAKLVQYKDRGHFLDETFPELIEHLKQH